MKKIYKRLLILSLAIVVASSSIYLPSFSVFAASEIDAILSAKEYSCNFENGTDGFEQYADFTNDDGNVINQDYSIEDSTNYVNTSTKTVQTLDEKVLRIKAGSTKTDFNRANYKALVNATPAGSPTDNDYTLAQTAVCMISPEREIWNAIRANEGSLQTAEFDLLASTITSSSGGAMITYAYKDQYNYDYITIGYWARDSIIVIKQHHVIEGKTRGDVSFRWAYADETNNGGNKRTPNLGQKDSETAWGANNSNLNWIHVAMSYIVNSSGKTVPQFVLTAKYSDENVKTYTYTVASLTSSRTSEEFVNVPDEERMIAIGTTQPEASNIAIDNFKMTFTTPKLDSEAEVNGFRTSYANEIAGSSDLAGYNAAISAYQNLSENAQQELADVYTAIRKNRSANIASSGEYSCNFENGLDGFQQYADFTNDAGEVINQNYSIADSSSTVNDSTKTKQDLGSQVLRIKAGSTKTDFNSANYIALENATPAGSPTDIDYRLAQTAVCMISPERKIWNAISANGGSLQTAEFDLLASTARSDYGGAMITYAYKDQYNYDYITIGYWPNTKEIVIKQRHVIEGKTSNGKSFRWGAYDNDNNNTGNKGTPNLGQKDSETAWGANITNLNWIHVVMSYIVNSSGKTVPQFVLTAKYSDEKVKTYTYTVASLKSSRTSEDFVNVPDEERMIAIGTTQPTTNAIAIDNFKMTFTSSNAVVNEFKTTYSAAFVDNAATVDIAKMYKAYTELNNTYAQSLLKTEVETVTEPLRPTSNGATLTVDADPVLCFKCVKPAKDEYTAFGIVITTNKNMYDNGYTELTKDVTGAITNSKTYSSESTRDDELIFKLKGLYDQDTTAQANKWASVLVARYYVVYELGNGETLTLYNTNDFGNNPTGSSIADYTHGETARSINGILKSMTAALDGVAQTSPYSDMPGVAYKDKDGNSCDTYVSNTLNATYSANGDTLKKGTALDTLYVMMSYKGVFTEMKNNGRI